MISLSLNSLWEYYEESVTLNRRKNVGRILNPDRNSFHLVQLTYCGFFVNYDKFYYQYYILYFTPFTKLKLCASPRTKLDL